jgi:endogenous inhibitor of DNA gyrase (YacG/DUF329 family)
MMPTLIKCPVCHTETPWTGNPHRPFCSERCRFVDLGSWADDKYRIVGDDREDESLPADEPDRQ